MGKVGEDTQKREGSGTAKVNKQQHTPLLRTEVFNKSTYSSQVSQHIHQANEKGNPQII